MKLLWRDFYSFVFRHDNSTALRQYTANLQRGIAWDRTPFNLSQISSFRQELSSDSWWQLSTRRPQDLVSHVEQLEAFVMKQQQQQQGGRLSHLYGKSTRPTSIGYIIFQLGSPKRTIGVVDLPLDYLERQSSVITVWNSRRRYLWKLWI